MDYYYCSHVTCLKAWGPGHTFVITKMDGKVKLVLLDSITRLLYRYAQ